MINLALCSPPIEWPVDCIVEQPVIAQDVAQQVGLSLAEGPLVHELEALDDQLDDLQQRVTTLEADLQVLEAQQVSPTVTLSGEAIFGLTTPTGADVEQVTTFQNSIELVLNASFTGEDELEIGLENGSGSEFSFNENITQEGQLSFLEDTEGGPFEFSELSYEFPVSDRGTLYISVTGEDLEDFNPILGEDTTGALSEFGSENPIHNLVEDVGLQFNYDLTESLNLGVGYFSEDAAEPDVGLFGGNYGAFAQLSFEPGDDAVLGFTYIRTSNDSSLETDTGSFRSQIDLDRPVIGNSFGLAGAWEPNERIAVGGWVGYTHAEVQDLGSAHVLNYAVTLALLDLGKEDNLLGMIVGQEPRLMGTSGFTIDDLRRDPDTSFHIEAFYTHRVSEFISVTPGFIWLTAPNHDTSNTDIFLFTVRTALEF